MDEASRSRRLSPPVVAAAVVFALLLAGTVILLRQWPERTAAAADTASCVYTSHSIARLDQFAALVGRPVTCALVFNDAAPTWDALVRPWFIQGGATDHRWDHWVAAGNDRMLVIAQSLIPANAPADWRARGAAGDYDARFRLLGRSLVAAGLGGSIIRLAHEANGDWFRHNIGTDRRQWKDWAKYWARVARILHRTAGAHFELDLTVSGGPRVIPLARWYPGDKAVDIIGVDQHDIAPRFVGTGQPARWTYQMTQPGGFDNIAAFALAHRKPISVPEWGLTDTARYGAGDDGYYIAAMLRLFALHHVRYHGFWDKLGTPGELALNPDALGILRSPTPAR